MLQVKPQTSIPRFYKQLCKQLKKPINPSLKNGIGEQDIFIRVDELTFNGTQRFYTYHSLDMEILQLMLTSCKFKSISFEGGQLEKVQKSSKINKSMMKSNHQFSSTKEFVEILRCVSKIMSKSLEILSLTLREIRITLEMVQIIAQVNYQIAYKNKGGCCSLVFKGAQDYIYRYLQMLQLRTPPCFAWIYLTISQLMQLEYQFKGQWMSILREEIELNGFIGQEEKVNLDFCKNGFKLAPEEDISLNGLCEINLSHNKLNSLFLKDLEYFLKHDRWVKSINLRANEIDQQGISLISEVNNKSDLIFFQILNKNKSLISIDIRDNPGTTNQLSKEIFSKLVRNMNDLKQIKLDDYKFQDHHKDRDENLLANVSAIPKQNSSYSGLKNTTNSFNNDQESPVMSFGEKIFELNYNVRQNSNKKDQLKLKFAQKQKENSNDSGCISCSSYKQKLKRAEQIIKIMKQENAMLRQQLQHKNVQQYSFQQSHSLQNASIQQPNVQHSTSQVLNQLWQTEHNHFNGIQQQQGDQEDMMGRIEYMMNELTRMMDSLDAQGSQTNNLTAHLSSTILGQNNNTRVIFERDDRERGNNDQYINILGNNSQNTSQIGNNNQNLQFQDEVDSHNS